MTYPDPNKVRCYRISINLSKYEQDLIIAIANYQGLQPAAVVRDLAIAKAMDLLSLAANPILLEPTNTDAQKLR